MTEPNRFALTAEQQDTLNDEIRDLLIRWARSLAGIADDAQLYRLDPHTRHNVELTRLAVASAAAEAVDDVEGSAAFHAAAHGSTYGEIATAAGVANRHTARYRYPVAGEAMRSRRWVQRNRASWLAALRVLVALATRIEPTEDIDAFLVANLYKMLPERDADVADADLVDALQRVDWFTQDASTDDDAARDAIDRARVLIEDWKATTSVAANPDTAEEDDEE